MTTTAPATFSTSSAIMALVDRCGIDVRRGDRAPVYSVPMVIMDAVWAAAGSAQYPSAANSNRALDAYEEVSRAYRISVDEVVRWADTWYDTLVVA